ncbi:TetR/AcrR family transcriptional regulator [Nonomuraea sp. NBC_01738]|uniref:TetR/AcrR family transcriptional regulator n=1 Tax=Nonomuraea sp. NBC_01738 TaxID=2976003 RepID=UPI002E0E4868|nr:TetR/AcrR family transcriptional regulator [Nonomuraea sp. NBC_01738]
MSGDRADRILDAAAELLLRLGYRKVTIDDIAQRAAIGKGTVYLHWRTKQKLFEALFLREALAYVREINAQLARDPSVVRPSTMLARSYLAIHERPVLRAMFSGDLRRLQEHLIEATASSQHILAMDHFYDVLRGHGLLRDDVPDLPYSIKAVHAGYYLLDAVEPASAAMDPQAKAASLAHVVRQAFEPPGEPDQKALADAAASVRAIFDELVRPYSTSIYGESRAS